MKIIFDLDGTLICSKRRLHELFCFLSGSNKLSFAQYWKLKHSGLTNQQILIDMFEYSKADVLHFVDNWMVLIESDQYLKFDTIDQRIPEFLSEMNKKHDLYLCTARQSVTQTNKQIRTFSINQYFKQIFVTEQKFSKEQILINSGLDFSDTDWIIGDTGHDILTGKALGLNTCAVLNGFMSELNLLKYMPDLVLTNVADFEGVLH
jgi:phosphoglycolate phosphatase